jgi:hypothetical protein
MGEVAHLTAATDRKGRFSGYYKCSLCSAEFRPNPKNPGELSKTFAAHVRLLHPAYKKNPVNVNQIIPDPNRERRY